MIVLLLAWLGLVMAVPYISTGCGPNRLLISGFGFLKLKGYVYLLSLEHPRNSGPWPESNSPGPEEPGATGLLSHGELVCSRTGWSEASERLCLCR